MMARKACVSSGQMMAMSRDPGEKTMPLNRRSLLTAGADCPASHKPCIAYHLCDERRLCMRLHCRPIDCLDVRPAVHFVGFRGEEYHSAVRAFGLPDFIHRGWDRRAQREIAACDTVVFAKCHDQPPSQYSFDDSAEPDDPATLERRSP